MREEAVAMIQANADDDLGQGSTVEVVRSGQIPTCSVWSS